jgi:hypothetical protein
VRLLERLLVHVEEAIRLASASEEAHLRIGLIRLASTHSSAAWLDIRRQLLDCDRLVGHGFWHHHLWQVKA